MDFLRICEACMKFPCKTGFRTLRLEVLRLSCPTPTTLSGLQGEFQGTGGWEVTVAEQVPYISFRSCYQFC